MAIFGLSIFTKNEKLMRKHDWLNNLKMFSRKIFQKGAHIRKHFLYFQFKILETNKNAMAIL